jgi:hypothetical protein
VRRNPDPRHQALYRAAAAGDVEAEAQLMGEFVRSGAVRHDLLQQLAELGDPAAQMVTGAETLDFQREYFATHSYSGTRKKPRGDLIDTRGSWTPRLNMSRVEAAITGFAMLEAYFHAPIGVVPYASADAKQDATSRSQDLRIVMQTGSRIQSEGDAVYPMTAFQLSNVARMAYIPSLYDVGSKRAAEFSNMVRAMPGLNVSLAMSFMRDNVARQLKPWVMTGAPITWTVPPFLHLRDQEARNPGFDARRALLRRAAAAGDPEATAELSRLERRGGVRKIRGVLHIGRGGIMAAQRAARGTSTQALRAPHYTASLPGLEHEVPLASGGVLILDDVDQFRRRSLAAVKKALDLMEHPPLVYAVISGGYRNEQEQEDELIERTHSLPAWIQELRRESSLQNPGPDARLRQLHTAAAGGDFEARRALHHHAMRTGQVPVTPHARRLPGPADLNRYHLLRGFLFRTGMGWAETNVDRSELYWFIWDFLQVAPGGLSPAVILGVEIHLDAIWTDPGHIADDWGLYIEHEYWPGERPDLVAAVPSLAELQRVFEDRVPFHERKRILMDGWNRLPDDGKRAVIQEGLSYYILAPRRSVRNPGPDARLRQLHAAAATGEPEAVRALHMHAVRTGQVPVTPRARRLPGPHPKSGHREVDLLEFMLQTGWGFIENFEDRLDLNDFASEFRDEGRVVTRILRVGPPVRGRANLVPVDGRFYRIRRLTVPPPAHAMMILAVEFMLDTVWPDAFSLEDDWSVYQWDDGRGGDEFPLPSVAELQRVWESAVPFPLRRASLITAWNNMSDEGKTQAVSEGLDFYILAPVQRARNPRLR